MEQYEKLTDEQLIEKVHSGDRDVTDYLMEKYKMMVRKKARAMYLIGGETEDLIQEGMIGLIKAVRNFDSGMGRSFAGFAETCVLRQMYTAIEASNRKKHMPLNSYISLYEESETNKNGTKLPLIDLIEPDRENDPEALYFGREYTEAFIERLKENLSPMEESSEFPILAYSRREDPRDVLIYKSEKKEQGTEEGSILTKTGAVIGTSSKRRMIQIQKLYPNAVFQGIRGNIQTRLSKLNKEEYDAAVLAAAGVKRLNMEAVIGRYFSVDEVIPAAGQGILAVQGRKEFLKDTVWRQYVDDKKSRVQALAERSFIRVLDGGCTSPSAAYAKVKGNELELTGLYYNEKSGQYFVKKAASYIEDASSLGERLALTMKKQFGER